MCLFLVSNYVKSWSLTCALSVKLSLKVYEAVLSQEHSGLGKTFKWLPFRFSSSFGNVMDFEKNTRLCSFVHVSQLIFSTWYKAMTYFGQQVWTEVTHVTFMGSWRAYTDLCALSWSLVGVKADVKREPPQLSSSRDHKQMTRGKNFCVVTEVWRLFIFVT